MAVAVARQLTEEEIVNMKLDDILQLEEPYRTHFLRLWADHIDEAQMGRVLIKANGGPTFTASYRGREIKVPPRGLRVERRVAIYLLQRYGYKGLYHGMDRATGITPGHWAGLSAEQREKFSGEEPKYQQYYLTHIPDNPAAEPTDEDLGIFQVIPEQEFEDALEEVVADE